MERKARHTLGRFVSACSKDSTVVVMGGTEKAAKTLPRISKTRMFRHFISARARRISAWQSFGFARCALGRLRLSARKVLCLYLWQKRRCSPKKKSRSGFKKGQSLHSLDELKKGDYVVHSLHGIGVFDGINKLEVGKITKDYIKIKYAKGDVLYVPVTQLDLVSNI